MNEAMNPAEWFRRQIEESRRACAEAIQEHRYFKALADQDFQRFLKRAIHDGDSQ